MRPTFAKNPNAEEGRQIRRYLEMWINKDKYQDLQDLEKRVKDLEKDLERSQVCVRQLMHIHDLQVYNTPIYYCNRDTHQEPAITIGDIENLTFTELAEYVINGKPITRTRKREEVVCPKENKNANKEN